MEWAASLVVLLQRCCSVERAPFRDRHQLVRIGTIATSRHTCSMNEVHH